MRNYAVIIICFCIVPAITCAGENTLQDSFLTADEQAAIDEALGYLKMDRIDMSFNKDYVNTAEKTVDHWRLKIVDRILHDPMILPDYSKILTSDVKKSRESVSLFLKIAARELEINLPGIILESEVPGLWEVLQKLYQQDGKKLHSREKDSIKHLDPKLSKALSWMLTGMMEIKPYLEKAYPDMSNDKWRELIAQFRRHYSFDRTITMTEEEEKNEAYTLLNFSDSVNYNDLYLATYAFLVYVEKARKILTDYAGNGIHETAVGPDDIVCDLETPLGRVLVGGLGSTSYDLSAAVIIDFGGDDTYRYLQDKTESYKVCSCILDFGGDDFYDAKKTDFVLGGALAGIGFLEDFAGNDHYRAGSFSLGSSLFGVGLLVDRFGDDVYEGDACTQGAGCFGIGYLHDGGGDDVYRAAVYAQGFAYTKGFGVLDDADGDDIYYAGGKYLDNPSRYAENYLGLSQGFSIGMRPYASGGTGVLVDSSGNDYYMTEVYGQGSSYWFSLGVLLDEQGHDNYTSLQYSQGTGIHLSAGILVDLDGNDKYTMRHLGQGSNHDLSVSFLLDKNGDDLFAGVSTVQGGALNNSVTVFIDSAGNDCYYASDFTNSQGNGTRLRGFGSIGIFLDLSGWDTYSTTGKHGKTIITHPMKDDSFLLTGEYGVSIDKNSVPREEDK